MEILAELAGDRAEILQGIESWRGCPMSPSHLLHSAASQKTPARSVEARSTSSSFRRPIFSAEAVLATVVTFQPSGDSLFQRSLLVVPPTQSPKHIRRIGVVRW